VECVDEAAAVGPPSVPVNEVAERTSVVDKVNHRLLAQGACESAIGANGGDELGLLDEGEGIR